MRRVFAWFLDALLIGLLLDLLLIPAALVSDGRIQPLILNASYTQCAPGDFPETLDPGSMPLESWNAVYLCETRTYWNNEPGHWIQLVQADQENPGWTVSATLPLAEDGTLVGRSISLAEIVSSLAWLVVVALMVGCELRWGHGPGKAVLGLRAEAMDGGVLSLQAALTRNVVKATPTLFAIGLHFWSLTQSDTRFDLTTASSLAVLVVFMALLGGPFLLALFRVPITMPHNRVAGSRVVRPEI